MKQLVLALAAFVASCGALPTRSSVSCGETSSSSGSGNSVECRADFSCTEINASGTSNVAHAVRCLGGPGDFRCDCLDNGVLTSKFNSVDFCSTSSRKAAAATGCGWQLQ